MYSCKRTTRNTSRIAATSAARAYMCRSAAAEEVDASLLFVIVHTHLIACRELGGTKPLSSRVAGQCLASRNSRAIEIQMAIQAVIHHLCMLKSLEKLGACTHLRMCGINERIDETCGLGLTQRC